MRINLEFAGGLDAIFNGKREITVELPEKRTEQTRWTVKSLLDWIQKNLLHNNDRSDMLIQKGTVRPGVLVLINQTDWEILGGLDASLADGDTIIFISTLHGG